MLVTDLKVQLYNCRVKLTTRSIHIPSYLFAGSEGIFAMRDSWQTVPYMSCTYRNYYSGGRPPFPPPPRPPQKRGDMPSKKNMQTLSSFFLKIFEIVDDSSLRNFLNQYFGNGYCIMFKLQ